MVKDPKLNEDDLQLAMTLSMAPSKYDKYIVLLKNDYGYTLSKSELAIVMEQSEQTISRRIKESTNIPNYIKSGEGVKASYIWPIVEVAEFLCNTIKTA